MGYRDTAEAASARIQALELEVRALRAAAELPPDPSRLTTPRERELTRALADAQRAVEQARHTRARPEAGRGVTFVLGVLGVLVLSVGMVVLLALVGQQAPRRLRATHDVAEVVVPLAPAEVPTPSAPPAAPPLDEAVCDVH